MQLDQLKSETFADIASAVKKVAKNVMAGKEEGGNQTANDPDFQRILQMKANQTDLDNCIQEKANKVDF